MAELTQAERLQPCLLDRLTDDHPEQSTESRDQRVMAIAAFRQAVLRDLVWLLNTSARPLGDDLYEYDEAASSVLNFGIRDVCGMTAAGVSPAELERELMRAIRRFEPRLLPASLTIQSDVGREESRPNTVGFEIRGTLWAQPLPDQLFIKTKIDLETGQCDLTRNTNG